MSIVLMMEITYHALMMILGRKVRTNEVSLVIIVGRVNQIILKKSNTLSSLSILLFVYYAIIVYVIVSFLSTLYDSVMRLVEFVEKIRY